MNLAGRTGHAFGLLACVALLAPSSGLAQFSVSPVILTLPREVDGGTSVGVFSIRNESEGSLEFRLQSVDFDQSPEGNHTYFPSGSHASSCGDDVRITPDALSVEARQSQHVRFEIPGGPRDESCWFMIFVESPATSESGVVINQRIGVKVFGIGESTSPGGEFHAGSIVEEDGIRSVALEYANPGGAPAWPVGSVEVRDFRGTVVASSAVRPFTVLPGSKRQLAVELPDDIAPGQYLAIPMLDFGGEYLAGTQIPFRVP
jgi:hypothetical protein